MTKAVDLGRKATKQTNNYYYDITRHTLMASTGLYVSFLFICNWWFVLIITGSEAQGGGGGGVLSIFLQT